MKSKKIISIISGVLLFSMLLSGCGASDKGDNTSSGSSNGGISSEYEISNKEIELTVHLGTPNSGPFDDKWPIFVQAGEMTNVNLKGTMPKTTTDFNQAFSLMVASGDMADIVQAGSNDFFKYGPEGAFEPLDDLINEHAPNIKKFFDENPEIRSIATGADGKIWFIPFILDGEAEAGWFIRQDWLEKLGLEQPKTVDELYEVLKAFREKDPNGNGKKDEVPYFHRTPDLAIDEILILWNAYPGLYIEDNKVKYGPVEDDFKVAMENLSKWYAEGLIDQEVFTRGNKARDILLADDVGGITHDWFGSTANYNEQLKGKIDNFKFEPMAPPKALDGKIKEYTSRAKARQSGWGIAASNKNKVETIKYFDFWFTEEGRRMANYGIEGDTYEMKDGKPILTDKVLNGEKPAVDIIRETGAQSDFGFQQDYFYEEQWTNEIALKGIKEYSNNKYFVDKFPPLKYTDEEQKELDKIKTKINTYKKETTQQWILGAKPINHEEFKNELKKLGIDKLIEINQASYERYLKELEK